METRDCILQRRAIRKFQENNLPDEVIREIVDCARFAPSWANTKAIRYICIVKEKTKKEVEACCTEHNQGIVSSAPALFVLTAVKGLSGLERGKALPYPSHTPEEWLMVDGGIAAQTLCLAAWDLGVGTVIMGGYDAVQVSQALKLPEDQILVAIIAAGYPDEAPSAPRRKELQDILQII